MLETNPTVESKCISKEVEQMNETNRLNNRLIQTDINTILSLNDQNENVHEDNNDSDDNDNDDDDDEESIHKTKSRNTLTSTKNTSFEEDLSSSNNNLISSMSDQADDFNIEISDGRTRSDNRRIN
uniref:Clone ZZD1252 mRNA sequence n=1 Tax=Schistosoma japonicum TaxID=6182 RepID=Q86EZ9_SCHJA|nr:hypothetical protein [Schistosoma japonicum]